MLLPPITTHRANHPDRTTAAVAVTTNYNWEQRKALREREEESGSPGEDGVWNIVSWSGGYERTGGRRSLLLFAECNGHWYSSGNGLSMGFLGIRITLETLGRPSVELGFTVDGIKGYVLRHLYLYEVYIWLSGCWSVGGSLYSVNR